MDEFRRGFLNYPNSIEKTYRFQQVGFQYFGPLNISSCAVVVKKKMPPAPMLLAYRFTKRITEHLFMLGAYNIQNTKYNRGFEVLFPPTTIENTILLKPPFE